MKKLIKKFKSKIKGEMNLEILKKRGLVVGENFKFYNGCEIDFRFAYLIKIGSNVTLSPKTTILAHDASTAIFLNVTKIGRVEIGNNVYVGMNSIIMPNVKIGNNVIIGAGSLVNKDVPDNSVVAGVPAKKIKDTFEYIIEQKNLLEKLPVFDQERYFSNNEICDLKQQKEVLEKLKLSMGYSDFRKK